MTRTLEQTFYLAIKPKANNGARPLSVRVTEKPPALASGEISLALNIRLPEALFQKPALSAKIEVPAGRVSAPVVTADVADNIAECVREHMGIDLKITVEPVSG